MNKLFLAFSFLMVLTSCTAKYKINGESSLARLDGKKLFLKIFNDGQMTSVDSAEVVHGLFTMKGKLDSSVMVMLYMDDMSIMPLILEKGNINIRIDNANILANGTPLNDRLYEFFSKKNSLDERADELERREAQLIMDGANVDEIQHKLRQEEESLNEEMNELVKSFIMANYENVLGPGIFVMFNNPYPVMPPVMEEIFKDAPESFKNNYLVKDYLVRVKEYEKRMNERH